MLICEGNPPVIIGWPLQRANNTERVSMSLLIVRLVFFFHPLAHGQLTTAIFFMASRRWSHLHLQLWQHAERSILTTPAHLNHGLVTTSSRLGHDSEYHDSITAWTWLRIPRLHHGLDMTPNTTTPSRLGHDSEYHDFITAWTWLRIPRLHHDPSSPWADRELTFCGLCLRQWAEVKISPAGLQIVL